MWEAVAAVCVCVRVCVGWVVVEGVGGTRVAHGACRARAVSLSCVSVVRA